ncbi:MAG TPA: hypothetical protein VLA15_11330 [Desulfurivibrionaceae bacterium]|nr:hypothetical protein [Desulfurivibrionaceae bacterium]
MSAKHLYPLGKVKQIVEAVGMDISYAHEDLVFLEHNAFLLQFTDHADEIRLHRNIEAEAGALADVLVLLRVAAAGVGLELTEGEPYRLTPVDGENIQLEFL